MNKKMKAPAENKEIDSFNPIEIAGAGVKKSVEMLLAILERKQNRIALIRPASSHEKDILATTADVVHRRRSLAQELMPANELTS